MSESRVPTDVREELPSVNPDPATLPTPTPTHHQQVAAQISSALADLAKQIPTLEGQHPTTVRFVRTHQNVPLEFIETVTSAVEATPDLQATKKFNVDEARDILQFVQAFRPIYDQFNALAKDLKFTIEARRAKIAADSLQMYHIAKGVARDPGSADVLAHVQNMRRDLAANARAAEAAAVPLRRRRRSSENRRVARRRDPARHSNQIREERIQVS